MGEAFTLLNLVVMGLWVAGILAALGIRCLNSRRRLDRRATRELAEQLGLLFDEHAAYGGVGAFGQLPDGRGVRLYDEHKRRRRGLLPWQRGLRVASILEVGVEGEAWEQLNTDQRDEARLLMTGHFYGALDRHRDELTRLGFADLSLNEQAVRLRAGHRLPTSSGVTDLLEVVGRIAAETEAACIRQVLRGAEPAPKQIAVEAGPASQETPDRPDDSPPAPEPWPCANCQALNPGELSHCQMCSAERSIESPPERAYEPGATPSD